MGFIIPPPSPTLGERARLHRRLALAALRGDRPASFRLSRYWSHIGQARALEAFDRTGIVLDNPAPAPALAGGAK